MREQQCNSWTNERGALCLCVTSLHGPVILGTATTPTVLVSEDQVKLVQLPLHYLAVRTVVTPDWTNWDTPGERFRCG